jgi:hypothetical protein
MTEANILRVNLIILTAASFYSLGLHKGTCQFWFSEIRELQDAHLQFSANSLTNKALTTL